MTLLGWVCGGLPWVWSLLEARRERVAYRHDPVLVACFWASAVGLGAVAVGALVWLLMFFLTFASVPLP